ncbi:MAG: hypothetical protein ACTSWN_14145 [Promethearchaeota archaeon]
MPDGSYIILTGEAKKAMEARKKYLAEGGKAIALDITTYTKTGELDETHKKSIARAISKQGDDPSEVEIVQINIKRKGGALKRFAKGFLMGGVVKGVSETVFGKPKEETVWLTPVKLSPVQMRVTKPPTIPRGVVPSDIEIQRLKPDGNVELARISPDQLNSAWNLSGVNIHLIGAQASGKTHIWHMLRNMLLPEDYRTTTWGHFNLAAFPTERGSALLADTAGKSEFEDLNKTIEHYFPANLYLTVYDYHNVRSWNYIQNEIRKIRAKKPDAAIILLGNTRTAPQLLEGVHEGIPHFQFNFGKEGQVAKFAERLKRHIQERHAI